MLIVCECVHYRSKAKLDSTLFLSHVLQSPIIEELGLLAIKVTPPRQGPMRTDRQNECFMELMITAEPEFEVAGWNYLVLGLRVIKSREWPPDIIAGWAARLRNTWGFWKQSTSKEVSRDFECSTTTAAAAASTTLLFWFSQWLKCIVVLRWNNMEINNARVSCT